MTFFSQDLLCTQYCLSDFFCKYRIYNEMSIFAESTEQSSSIPLNCSSNQSIRFQESVLETSSYQILLLRLSHHFPPVLVALAKFISI